MIYESRHAEKLNISKKVSLQHDRFAVEMCWTDWWVCCFSTDDFSASRLLNVPSARADLLRLWSRRVCQISFWTFLTQLGRLVGDAIEDAIGPHKLATPSTCLSRKSHTARATVYISLRLDYDEKSPRRYDHNFYDQKHFSLFCFSSFHLRLGRSAGCWNSQTRTITKCENEIMSGFQAAVALPLRTFV